MKKFKKILFISVIIAIIILVIGFCLFSNIIKDKKSITAEEFKTILSEKGFTINDSKELLTNYPYIDKAYIASNNVYNIEFFELSSENYTELFFNNLKNIVESSKSKVSSSTNVNAKNHYKYTLTCDDIYTVISSINNTTILVRENKSNKQQINKTLKLLGY